MYIAIIRLVRTKLTTDISYRLIRTCTCEYQEEGNVSFPENLAYVLNELSHIAKFIEFYCTY